MTIIDVKFKDYSILKNLLKSVQSLIEEMTLTFYEDGTVSFQVMDSSHISVCNGKLKKDAFTRYNVTKEISISFRIQNLLRFINKKCEVTFQVDEKEDKLLLICETNHIQKIHISLIHIDTELMEIPEIENDVGFRLKSKYFGDIINSLKDIHDDIIFKCNNNKLNIAMKGDDIDTDIEIKEVEFNKCQEYIGKYSYKYISLFLGPISNFEFVNFKLTNNLPLLLFYTSTYLDISYFLAPKIED